MKIKNIILPVLLLIGTVGCEPKITMQTPEGFAKLDASHTSYLTKAMSADQVVVTSKICEGLEGADVNFWAASISRELTSRKYVLQKQEDITSNSSLKGKLLEFKLDSVSGTYLYYVAVFVKGKKVLIGEAGGQEAAIAKHRKVIIDSFKTLKFGSNY